jgi:addiction module HigA family antidote
MKHLAPHPGEHIRERIDQARLTITEAAAAIGIARPGLSDLLNGKRGISAEMAVRLSKVFGESEESWLLRQARYDLEHVRRDRIKVKRLNFG